MLWNVEFTRVPTWVNVAIATIEIKAAIKAYSINDAPLSSNRKLLIIILFPLVFQKKPHPECGFFIDNNS